MAKAFFTELAIAAATYAGRYGIQAWQEFKARPPKMRRFYEGGFEATMTRREAALILGVRKHTSMDKIKEAHRRVVIANHPDVGGSHYLASKIDEAKDVLLGKTKGGGSASILIYNNRIVAMIICLAIIEGDFLPPKVALA